MFRRVGEDHGTAVHMTVDGVPLLARKGDTVSAAMMAAGLTQPYRLSAVSGKPRAPYCMMGVCFDCLVTIDGVGNRQGCLVPVNEGMNVTRQQGKREIGA
jgi:D-hydroxyproline dehydrogenase subunit gamma